MLAFLCADKTDLESWSLFVGKERPHFYYFFYKSGFPRKPGPVQPDNCPVSISPLKQTRGQRAQTHLHRTGRCLRTAVPYLSSRSQPRQFGSEITG